jgi:BirA family biotin operon repressor/biotin-[acetyl-CoA-carboxylase] ligase
MYWNTDVLKEKFDGKFFGHSLYYHNETRSTNDDAYSLGLDGCPEGTMVIADHQIAGKGRLQRSWHSPPGLNIYTSVILRPQIEPFRTTGIPIMAGVAVAEILSLYCPGRIELKWPNDVIIKNKKVCGILSEAKMNEGKVDFIVLGMGINVNIQYDQFSEDIRDIATSLAIESGKKIDRLELIIHLYENLEKWYKQQLQKGFGPVKNKWLELTSMIGQMIEVKFGSETIEGKAVGLDDDGALILLSKDHREIKVSAGDATIMR